MPVPSSSGHVPPDPIQTELKTPLPASSGKDTLPSVGPMAYDITVVPPSHSARTLILWFDGTGNESVKDVRAYMLSPSAHVLLADHVPLTVWWECVCSTCLSPIANLPTRREIIWAPLQLCGHDPLDPVGGHLHTTKPSD